MPFFLMRSTIETYETTHKKKSWIHEIPTRKYFGLTKCPREKTLDQRNTYEGTMADGTRLRRPKVTRGPRNLAHSKASTFYSSKL